MSKHDRVYETIAANGQRIITHDGPGEIASWFFPYETPEEDEKRIALTAAIEELLDRRIAETAAEPPETGKER